MTKEELKKWELVAKILKQENDEKLAQLQQERLARLAAEATEAKCLSLFCLYCSLYFSFSACGLLEIVQRCMLVKVFFYFILIKSYVFSSHIQCCVS